MIVLTPDWLFDVMSSMPLAWAIAFSSGVVMKPATTAGSAPYSVVVTVTTAFSVRGYCSTGSEPTARNPSTRIIRLTTVASTGRRMKMSVKFIVAAPYCWAKLLGCGLSSG